MATSASLSLPLSQNDTNARALSHRSSLLSTDIRKIQNKSGEPETVENTRWRIMIRCETFFPDEEKKRDSKSVHFFFHFRYPTREATTRPRTNASLARTLTAGSFCAHDSLFSQQHSDGVLYSQAMVSPKLNPLINSGKDVPLERF